MGAHEAAKKGSLAQPHDGKVRGGCNGGLRTYRRLHPTLAREASRKGGLISISRLLAIGKAERIAINKKSGRSRSERQKRVGLTPAERARQREAALVKWSKLTPEERSDAVRKSLVTRRALALKRSTQTKERTP